jgi:hypothetical protein
MSVLRRARALSVAVVACAGLAACGGEPSEADMKSAMEQIFKGINEELDGVGKVVGKDLTTKVQAMKKLGCAKAEGNPGYRCDFTMTITGPMGELSQKASGRFVKSDSGWTVLEK